jgi:hypothetical protein
MATISPCPVDDAERSRAEHLEPLKAAVDGGVLECRRCGGNSLVV